MKDELSGFRITSRILYVQIYSHGKKNGDCSRRNNRLHR